MSDGRKRGPDRDEYQFPRKERRTGKVIKILCPYYCTGAVIGTRGASINQIKEESGTNIQVSKGAARFPKTDERVISVSGELEGVQKVVNFVQNKIRTEQPSPQARGVKFHKVDARKTVCKVLVSDQVIGKLIGKGGENVNRMKSEYDVKIQMMKSDDAVPGLNERIVSVEGEDKGVDNCIAEIVKDSYEDERSNLDYNLDYNDFNSYGDDSNSGTQEGSYGSRPGGYSSGAGSYGNSRGGYGNQDSSQSGNYGNQDGSQGVSYGSQGSYSNVESGGSYEQKSSYGYQSNYQGNYDAGGYTNQGNKYGAEGQGGYTATQGGYTETQGGYAGTPAGYDTVTGGSYSSQGQGDYGGQQKANNPTPAYLKESNQSTGNYGNQGYGQNYGSGGGGYNNSGY